jgi:hypothetical protein
MQATASKLLAAVLAAALCGPAAAEHRFTASEASMLSGSVLVILPFYLVLNGSQEISRSLSNVDGHKRWKVTGVKEQGGGKTEANMVCDDGKIKLTMTAPTPAVREQRLAVGDMLDIDRIGKAGYVVKKGQATIGVLAEPGSEMVHSKARS